MNYKTYKLTKEEKLKDIAVKFNTTEEEIKGLNPNMKIIKLPFMDAVVMYGEEIMIPMSAEEMLKEDLINTDIIAESFSKQARYRCEQNNIITVNGEPGFSSEVKTQYLLSSIKKTDKSYYKVNLEDYINSMLTSGFEETYDLIKDIELLRNEVIFSQSNSEKIDKIYNMKALEKKWEIFYKEKAHDNPFLKELNKKNAEAYNDFITNAKMEFSNNSVLAGVLEKNYFYHILLKANLGSKIEDYVFSQGSLIFPEVELNTKVIKSIVTEDELSITYRLVGELDRNNLNERKLINIYNDLYLPLIKYSYSEFDSVYRITYSLEKKTHNLISASITMSEQVKNNYQIISKFELKQVDL